MAVVKKITDGVGTDYDIGAAWDNVSGKPESFTPSAHTHSASDVTSGTLPIARGGTGATTAKGAEYNIITNGSVALGAASDNVRIGILHQPPSSSNGVFAGYRTASQFADYMNGKIKKLVPFWITGENVSKNASWARVARIPVGGMQRNYGGVERRWAQWAQRRLSLVVEGRFIGSGEMHIQVETSGSVDVPTDVENQMEYAIQRLAYQRIVCNGTANRDYIQLKWCFNEEQYEDPTKISVQVYCDVWIKNGEYNTTSIYELGKNSDSIEIIGWSSDCIHTTPETPDWTYYDINTTKYNCAYGVEAFCANVLPQAGNGTGNVGTSDIKWGSVCANNLRGNLIGTVDGETISTTYLKHGYNKNYLEGPWIGAARNFASSSSVEYWKLCSFTMANYWSLQFSVLCGNATYDSNLFEEKIISIYGNTNTSLQGAVEVRNCYWKIASDRGYGNNIYYEITDADATHKKVTIYIKARYSANLAQYCRIKDVFSAQVNNLVWYTETSAGIQPENPVAFAVKYNTTTPAGSSYQPVYVNSYGIPTAIATNNLKAGKDASGNTITATYATKTELNNKQDAIAAMTADFVNGEWDK